MRRWGWTLALLLSAGSAAAQDRPVPRGAGQSGSVVSRVSGEVVRFFAEAGFRTLVLGQDLLGGDLVRTGERGALGILFVDGTVLRLHARTELLVKTVGREAELELRRGTLWARAPRGQSDITVETPTAAAGIRGTDWSLSVEGDGTTRLQVFDGSVELYNGLGSVTAGAGQQAVAAPGQAPVLVGVANRAEAPQMLYTIAATDAADLLSGTVDELAAGEPAPAEALAQYRRGLQLMQRRDPAAAGVLEAAARRLGRERAAAARWLAAYARVDQGLPFREPPAGIADADAIGAAFAAAMSGDLDRAQAALDSVAPTPAVQAAAVQLAILRDDAPRARALVADLRRRAPGSTAALWAEADLLANVEGRHTQALALLRRAVAQRPDDVSLLNDLAMAEEAVDHPLEAEAAYRRALALDPDDPAVLANLATLLLDQERLAEARALAERLLERDPTSYLALRTLGRIALQQNDPDAQQMMLRALAAQPAAAETSLGLAIAAQQAGDAVRAQQELDAAGRLDANDATVPLVRAITALDANRVDDAILAARQAGELQRRQDSSGRVVAADRSAGSPLASAYSAIGLDGWARYAADRSYDPLSPASLFGEGFLERMSLGRGGVTADGHGGSVANGLMLEPLAASFRLRGTDLFRRPFLDGQAGLVMQDGELIDGFGSLTGMARVPVPLAFALELDRNREETALSLDTLDKGVLALGTQFGARAGAFLFVDVDDERSLQVLPLAPGVSNLDDLQQTERSFALGGHVRLRERSFLTFYLGHGEREGQSVSVRNRIGGVPPVEITAANFSESSNDHLGLAYQSESGSGSWTAGVELGRDEVQNDVLFRVIDLRDGSVILQDRTLDTTRSRSARLFLGHRQALGEQLTGEWLVTLDRLGDDWEPGGRAGLAFSPAPGHWLRGAVLSDPQPGIPTLAPLSTLGLVPLRLPHDGSALRGVLLRYDVEVGRRLLLGLEHQRLRAGRMSFPTDDSLTSIDVRGGVLNATGLTADWWLGRGVGVNARLVHADGRIAGGGPRAGRPLPEVPDWTAGLGLAFLRPSGLGGSVSALWTSERFRGGRDRFFPEVLTVDASLSYSPPGDRLSVTLTATNLFDEAYRQTGQLQPNRRQLRLELIARF